MDRARRRLLVWCLITFAGVIAMSAALEYDLEGLPGIVTIALALLLLVAGAFGMLRRLGEYQDDAARPRREQSDKGTNDE